MSSDVLNKTEINYEKIKALLDDQETFPLDYTHKFIGKNSVLFAKSIEAFEKKFPKAVLKTARTSKSDAHLAMTYVYRAESSEDVIVLLKETGKLEDLLVIL